MEDLSLQATVIEPKITKASLKMALMSPAGLSKVWVLLEGEPDVKVFSQFFSEQTISVKQAINDRGRGGYKIVEDIVTSLSSEFPKANILGIRDKDYTPYYVPAYQLPDNVFITDKKDLEMTLADAPSVRACLSRELPEFVAAEDKISPAIRQMGYIRAYAGCNSIKCQFDKIFKAAKIWDESTRSLHDGWKTYCDNSVETHIGVTSTDIDSFVALRGLDKKSLFDVGRGHDYVAYLSKAMVDIATYSEDFISGIMYNNYSKADFASTQLCASIKSWQQARGVMVVE